VLLYSGENLYVRLNYGRSQMCIGRAESASPGGPFSPDPHPLICPGDNNHWAIDPNVWVSPASHNVFVQWRQDVGTSESRIYGARYSRDGRTRLTTARLLLSDSAVSWEGAQIENPAIELESGTYYLFFSGDNWNSKNYATGVASCGSRIVDGGKCTSIYASSRPWLGWSGRPGGAFFHTPEDIWGPGGLSFVSDAGGGIRTNPNGDPYVAIHWWLANDLRPMAIYALPWSIYGPVPANF
jgi:arabinan endo-1,5-alpha-L-arabinosidase